MVADEPVNQIITEVDSKLSEKETLIGWKSVHQLHMLFKYVISDTVLGL